MNMCFVTINKYKLLIWILFLSTPFFSFSQEKKTATLYFNNEPFVSVLTSLEHVFDIRFSYPDKIIEEQYVSLSEKEWSLQDVIDILSTQSKLNFQFINERYIILTENELSLDEIQVLDNVIINSYLTKGISKKKNAVFHLKPERIGLLPGLIEADVLESIQQLPGVTSPNETASGFTVRGGGSDQNRMIWNGINMYHKGHLFGMISAFNSNSSENVLFINKGTHPRYGERISSVVDISSHTNVANKINAKLGVNGISVDGFIKIPVIKNKLSVLASIRRSYTEWIETETFKNYTNKVFQTTKIEYENEASDDFYFIDYNVSLNYKPTEKHDLKISTIYIDNQLDFFGKNQPSNTSFNDILSIKNEGYGMQWDWKLNPKYQLKTNAFVSKYRLNYNFIEGNNEEQLSDFDKRNVIFDSGINSEIDIKVSRKSNIALGYQYNYKDVSYAYLKTEELSFVLDSDQRRVTTHSLFGNYTYTNPKVANITAGFRINNYSSLDILKFEPRILVYKKIFKNVGVQVSGEFKNQIINEIDETVVSDLSLENKLWRLVDGSKFPVINSKQFSAGFVYSSMGWTLDLDHYYKKIEGVSALSLGFLNPIDSDFHIGDQEIFGIDFYIKKSFRNFNTWVSYSYNDVTSTFQGLNNNKSFPSSNNISHAFSTSLAYKWNKFQMAISWKWRTGKPYTEAIIDSDSGDISFDKINDKQLPEYHRLDFSTTYHFKFSKENKLNGKVGFSIRNIYDKKNHLSREYSGNNSLNDPIEVVDKTSLGFTPNFIFQLIW
ncbi:MAG: TonB-dependent receptor plug domain-containing protein [Flavobacteriaceae bacterium]|nr:TonB-dependent receptor plug domain-containing protein [Flavobacteriaceae bacterium]